MDERLEHSPQAPRSRQISDLTGTTIVYCRAEKVLTHPDDYFKDIDCSFFQIVCYKTIECKLPEMTNDVFSTDDYIFFTAPSAVESYRKQFGTPQAKVIAIGKTTEQAIKNIKWDILKTLDKPDIDSVLEYM